MRSLLTLIIYFSINSFIYGQKITYGNWYGVFQYENTNVNFNFNLVKGVDKLLVTIINGEEIITLKNVIVKGDSLIIPLIPFDASIKAKLDDHVMVGEWKKGYRNEGIPFKAFYGKPRFEKKRKTDKILPNTWLLEFQPKNGQSYSVVGNFKLKGNKVIGTFLSPVSDFRYFEGELVQDSLLLSSFDGAHAFKFISKIEGNKLNGIFHFDNQQSEKVSGTASETASISSPLKIYEPEYRISYDILSAGNPLDSVDESKYFDKVLILQLFGTWCPNSMDQTNFLTSWYRNKHENVEVLAVAYEPNFSTEYGLKRIESYIEEMKIPYDIKLGGELSKGQAALSIPYLDRINAFPTLLIIDKYGFVRFEFSYFNGPATGVYFEQFKKDFDEAVHQLAEE